MRKAFRHAGVAALAAAPALALLAVLGALPAAAHSTLVESTPADGSTLSTPLTTVELVFNEPVQNEFAQVVVLGGDGAEYQSGDPQIVGGTVTQSIDSLPDGEYALSYRVVSADGHPVEGTLSFTMAAGATAGPPTGPPTGATTAPSSPAESTGDTPGDAPGQPPTEAESSDGGWILGAVGGAAVVAVLVFLATGGRRRGAPGDTEKR